jgi:hypothetical protein
MRRLTAPGLALALLIGGAAEAMASPSLRGSPAAMREQNQVAREHGLAFYRTPTQIRQAVERGDLVPLEGNEDYAVADFVRFPYAHPAARLFVERLSAQYREACGQQLVVTSATRPSSGQPRNAHQLSVHPAGMAIDLRVSDRASCRNFLETSLMNMERQGLLNGIRERHPPHYHVAIYPEAYLAYAEARMAEEAALAAEQSAGAVAAVVGLRGAIVRAAAAVAEGSGDAGASALAASGAGPAVSTSLKAALAALVLLLGLAPAGMQRLAAWRRRKPDAVTAPEPA